MGSVSITGIVAVSAVAGATVLIASVLVRVIAGRGRASVLAPAVLDAAIAASLAAVAVATLSPLAELGTGLDHPSEVNVRPLEAMRGAPAVYGVVNVLLLVPTIVLLAQRWRRAGVLRLTVTGAALSAGVEVLQLVHPVRGSNVDDLLLNTAGAAAAAVVGVVVRRLRTPLSPRRAAAAPAREERPRVIPR